MAKSRYNRLKGHGLFVKGGTIYNQGREAVGGYTTCGNDIEEISGLPPELDNQISGIILGMK